MKNNTILTKIFLSLLTVGVIIWLGGTVARNAIAFDIFVPGTELTLKNWYSDEARLITVSLFRITGFYTIIGFCMTFVSSIYLFLYYRKEFKLKGWLLMSFVLILLASPIEFYLMYYDIKIILAFNNELIKSFNDTIVQDYFVSRYSKLTIPATLSFLSAFTAVLIIIWQPLNRKKIESNNNENDNNINVK
ncbi:MAG: hypothetical protein V1779_02710 [bacterium]